MGPRQIESWGPLMDKKPALNNYKIDQNIFDTLSKWRVRNDDVCEAVSFPHPHLISPEAEL